MENLSSAQFGMISNASAATAGQTKPLLGTVQKVADGLGYQLKRERSVNTHYDAAGNIKHTDTTTSQGFRSKTKRVNADGSWQILNEGRRSLPGLFGGHTQFNNRYALRRNGQQGQPGNGGQPGPAGPTPGPINPLPRRGPFGPGGVGRGIVPTPQSPPVAPTPPYGTPLPFNRIQPQNLNQPFPGNNSPTVPLRLPFNGSGQPQTPPAPPLPAAPLPFRNAPAGRSDYGQPPVDPVMERIGEAVDPNFGRSRPAPPSPPDVDPFGVPRHLR